LDLLFYHDIVRVHIVAQQANRYIMVFHIMISYDIYLSGRNLLLCSVLETAPV